MCQVWLKLAQWFWKRRFLKLSIYFYYFPIIQQTESTADPCVDTAETMDSTRLNDSVVVFFQSYTYQNYEESQTKTEKIMLTILGLWSNTMFRVLRFRNVNIRCKKEGLGQKLNIKLVLIFLHSS